LIFAYLQQRTLRVEFSSQLVSKKGFIMMKIIPNFLTIFRILLIPVLVVFFYLESSWAHYIVAGIFIFASITDYIDGSLARKLKAQSDFGKMLDPIADKMLVVSTLVMLVDRRMAPVIPILAIICREIFVSGMREYFATIKIKIRVNILGKAKTIIQMIAIIILLLGSQATGWLHAEMIGEIAIWIAAVMTLVSGYVYLHEGFKHVSTS
jgi:cardiolipin synthase (CMP-forming)